MHYTYVDSPVEPLLLAADDGALAYVSFTAGIQPVEPAADWVEDADALRPAAEQLAEYFSGERQTFDMPLAMNGTAFQKRVWDVLLSIPFGQAWTYGQIAEQLGTPGAARAVGRANATNPLAIVVPCHRVIGSNGSLTGFGGGLEAKQWLLRFEGASAPEHVASGQPGLF